MKVLLEMLRERIKKELEGLGELRGIYKKRKYKLYHNMKEKEISSYQFLNEIGKVKNNLISYTFVIVPNSKISLEKLERIAEKYEKEFYFEKKIYITPDVFSDNLYIDLYKPYDLNLLLEILRELKGGEK
jgi:hypothetical protein